MKTATTSSPAKILVVDDEELFLRLFKTNFRKQIKEGKYQFSYCHNPEEVFRRIKNNRPDLVLLDLEMDGLDGFELMSQLKKTYSQIPTMVVSTFGSKENFRQAMHRRAFDFLTKPINFQELETTIDSVLELSKLDRVEPKVITVPAKPSLEQKLQNKVTPSTLIKLIKQLSRNQQYKIVQKLIEDFKIEDLQDLQSDLQYLLLDAIEEEEEEELLKEQEEERLKKGLLPLRQIKEGKIDKKQTRKRLSSGEIKEYGPFFYLRNKLTTGEHKPRYLGRYEEIAATDPVLAKIIKKEYPKTIAKIEQQIQQFQRNPGDDLVPDDSWNNDDYWDDSEENFNRQPKTFNLYDEKFD